MGLEASVQVDPTVCGQWLARRSTIAGCSDPTVAPSRAALAVVHPLGREDLRVVVLGRMDFVAGSLAGGNLGPGVGIPDLEVDTVAAGEDSLDPEGDTAVAGEEVLQLAELGRRRNLMLHEWHLVQHETSPWMDLCALFSRW